jgi:hypothetical protein
MRSRLEARWAAFFDLCEWNWDYEPDLGLPGWIPDFAIYGKHTVLVEIKPITAFCRATADKMERAATEGGVIPPEGGPATERCLSNPPVELLLLGTQVPAAHTKPIESLDDTCVYLGWMWQGCWAGGSFGLGDYGPDVGHDLMSYSGAIHGTYDGNPVGWQWPNIERTKAMWREAGNRVQWRKPTW